MHLSAKYEPPPSLPQQGVWLVYARKNVTYKSVLCINFETITFLCINFEIINVVTEPDHNGNNAGIYRKTATLCGDH
jgi:hypothetical protein